MSFPNQSLYFVACTLYLSSKSNLDPKTVNTLKGIIIGGGIGGLTTSIALRQKGIETVIFEQAPQISEIGAGVWMASNALNILSRLGLSEKIITSGRDLSFISVIDIKGKPISQIELSKIKKRYGFGTVAIHRGTLQKILLNEVPSKTVFTGKRFERYSQSGSKITAHFSDGSQETADFLVAADGIHSNARKQLYPDQKLRYSGQTCWRVIADLKIPGSENGQMFEIWGNGKGLRAAYSEISDSSIYSYFTVDSAPGLKDDPNSLKDHLNSLFKDFPEFIRTIIRSSDSHKFLRNDLYDFEPIDNWVDNRMVLIGDAAHATTPNLGQGACQAVEDAFALAVSLAAVNDPAKAFVNFQQMRMKKAHYITRTSWMLGKLASTSGLRKFLAKTVMRITPESVSNSQFDKIYKVTF